MPWVASPKSVYHIPRFSHNLTHLQVIHTTVGTVILRTKKLPLLSLTLLPQATNHSDSANFAVRRNLAPLRNIARAAALWQMLIHSTHDLWNDQEMLLCGVQYWKGKYSHKRTCHVTWTCPWLWRFIFYSSTLWQRTVWRVGTGISEKHTACNFKQLVNQNVGNY